MYHVHTVTVVLSMLSVTKSGLGRRVIHVYDNYRLMPQQNAGSLITITFF